MFQFTHPGGVRLAGIEYREGRDDVSIHAPGRGATALGYRLAVAVGVSIHAPGRGATR